MTYEHNHPFKFTHMVYFALVDRSEETRTLFLAACRKYLSEHPGMIHFSLGVRAVEMQRDVNVRDFDITMNMIFKSKTDYDDYATDPRHEEFITVTAGMSSGRRVFDSYLIEDAPASQAKKVTTSKSKRR